MKSQYLIKTPTLLLIEIQGLINKVRKLVSINSQPMWNNSTMNRMITKVKMNQTMMINNIIKNKKANKYIWTSN